MKTAIVICAFLAVAFADETEPIPIVSQQTDVDSNGTYHSSFETGNGIKFEESGSVVNAGPNQTEVVKGSYSYKAPDGSDISLTYTADDKGFQPVGAHLPVAPEVPAAIARALEWIAAHPQPEEKQA